MVAVEADSAQIELAARPAAVPLPRAAGRRRVWTAFSALEYAGLIALAGGALLITFVLLGRPPLSLPTLAGMRTFVCLAVLGLLVTLSETYLLARVTGRTSDAARRLSLAGYLPLGAGWGLAALL